MPDALDELLARHDLAGVLDQVHEHIHDLWFQVQRAGRTRQCSVRRPDEPRPELETRLASHGRFPQPLTPFK